MTALVSLIGAGPGDPGLLTLRAADRIRSADTVLCDALVHAAVLRHARPEAEVLVVGKRGGGESATQEEILHTMLFRARQGRRVARVKGGDPMIFGRAAEEMAFLASHGVPYEVVPGVTAALGASAYAAIPLTHRDVASSVAFVTATERPDREGSAHDWSRLATATQTLVFYMGVRRLADDLRTLVEHGRDPATPAAVVQLATHPAQRVVVGTVGDLAARAAAEGISTPAVVIVGAVVALREGLRWWDLRPLRGRRVVITRAREQGRGLVDALIEEGAEALEFPAIRFEGPSDPEALARAVEGLRAEAPDAIAFTSANGVARFFDALRAARLDARALGRARVVAIGPATAESLRRNGIEPDAVPREHVGEAVADAITALLDARVEGARVLIPRAEEAREALPEILRARGATVNVVPAYRTVSAAKDDADSLRDALREGVDAVTFASASTVQHVCDALGEEAATLLARTAIATIGPITSDAVRRRGMTVSIEAAVYTADGLLDALRAHFARTGTPT